MLFIMSHSQDREKLVKKNYWRVLLRFNFTQIGPAILNNQASFYCLSAFSFTLTRPRADQSSSSPLLDTPLLDTYPPAYSPALVLLNLMIILPPTAYSFA